MSVDIIAAGRVLDLLQICSSFCVRACGVLFVGRSVDEIRVVGGQPIAGWAS